MLAPRPKRVGETKVGLAKKPGEHTWKSRLDPKARKPSAKARQLLRRVERTKQALAAERKLGEDVEQEFVALKRTLQLLPRKPPPPGVPETRTRDGEPYYGRRWCDMTRALDEGARTSVEQCKDAALGGSGRGGSHGRTYSDMSRQVAIYTCNVQSPPMQVPPQTGRGFTKKKSDITAAHEQIMWAMRNRYPQTTGK